MDMNHKQKLGYMALGAGILAIGITLGQWVTPNIEAQSNGMFDEITCRRIKVVDAEGNSRIELGTFEDTSVITVLDKAGNKSVNLNAPEGSPYIDIIDKAGNVSWRSP